MTHELNYAYAVARTKAVEKRLLTQSITDQLVTASSYDACVRSLRDNGWEIPNHSDAGSFIRKRQMSVFDFLCETAPDRQPLSILTVENDFHNLKAAVKCIFGKREPHELYALPTSVELQAFDEVYEQHRFSSLPEWMRPTAEKAYSIATETENGQKIDMLIDCEALKHLGALSKQSDCELLVQIAQIKIAAADIKIALRCASTGKETDFIKKALVACSGLDTDLLAARAAEGVEAVLGYLETTDRRAAASAFRDGTTAFEKWVDDAIISLVRQYRWKCLGLEPLIAYYYANMAEIKNVRIILGAKLSGADEETIRQRVRELYV